jgi:hypothetical protein
MRLNRLSILIFAGAAAALAQSKYIEVYNAKYRPDRFAEFDAMARKISDANRRAKDKGDYWIAYEELYGDGGNVYMVSPRDDLAAIEPAMAKFMGALSEYVGLSPERFATEWMRNISSQRAELFARRWDLSSNVPKDPAEMVKETAHARYAMVIQISLKAGRAAAYEKQLHMLKEAMERNDTKVPAYVHQAVAGSGPVSMSAVLFAEKLADFEKMPTIKNALGPEYDDFVRMTGENVERTESRILVVRPEWSNVPKMIAEANPSFWNVKPVAAKPKPAATKAAPAKPGL